MPMGRPLLLALALIASHTAAMAPGADPGVNAPFDRPDPQRWGHILEQPGRELYDRRHAIIANVGLAALITPTGDPLNLALMALPMIVFYEIGILLARILGKKKQPEAITTTT